jgi:hypothetical protein
MVITEALWFCEPAILTPVDGETPEWTRYTQNDGKIITYSRTLLTFSHWSWHRSNAKIMMVDLQGYPFPSSITRFY